MSEPRNAVPQDPILVEVKGLKMYFPITQGIILQRQVGAVKAVDGLDFYIRRGETLGLVGGKRLRQVPRPDAPSCSSTALLPARFISTGKTSAR